MTAISIHDVIKVELISAFPGNSGSRTLRITATDWQGHEIETEIVVFAHPQNMEATAALDALPRSNDFRFKDGTPSARAAA